MIVFTCLTVFFSSDEKQNNIYVNVNNFEGYAVLHGSSGANRWTISGEMHLCEYIADEEKEKIILRHVLIYQKSIFFFFSIIIPSKKGNVSSIDPLFEYRGKKDPRVFFSFFYLTKIQINCERFGCSYYD